MRLHFNLDADGEPLFAIVSGSVSFDAIWQILKQICDTASQMKLTQIIVDALGAWGVTSTIDRYTLGVNLVTYCGELRFWPRLAFVGEPPVVDGFGVLVAKNRGLDTQQFLNRQEALAWVRVKRVA